MKIFKKITKETRRLPEIFRNYKNPLTYYFLKLGVSGRQNVFGVKMNNGLKFKIHGGNSDINSLDEVFLTDGYNKFLSFLEPDSNFLDIGANIGIVSVAAAKRLKDGKVSAFEPNPYLFDLLKENIRLNNCEGKVSIHKLCVAGKAGERKMNFVPGDWGGASIVGDDLSPRKKNFKVQCIDFSRIFSLSGLEEIDFMKIDVEGAEEEILGGADENDFEKIKNIFLEYHEPRVSGQKLKALLENAGFRVEFIVNPPALYAVRK